MTSLNFARFSPENSPKMARCCCATEKPFEPGEKAYSALFEENGEIVRRDYCAAAWKANPRPENALAWWSTKIPLNADKKAPVAPNDALADLFESLADRPDQAALRYALALLLTRRRVFRFEREETTTTETTLELGIGGDVDGENALSGAASAIVVYSPRRETSFVVPVVAMTDAQIADVQARLAELL